MQEQYFASVGNHKLAEMLTQKVLDYYDTLEGNGLLKLLRHANRNYYGISSDGVFSSHKVSDAGEKGQLSAIKVNHYRNLIQHILGMIIQMRPTFDAKARNSDYESQTQAILANNLLDYYLKSKNFEKLLKISVEKCLVYGASYVEVLWNPEEGDEHITDDAGNIEFKGDVEAKVHDPLGCIQDVRREFETKDWVITREFVNKWDLIGEYPERAEELKNVFKDHRLSTQVMSQERFVKMENDDIPVFRFYHRDTKALQGGRYAYFVNNEILLQEGPLAHKEIPVYSMQPANIFDTSQGYSNGFDLLGISEAIDQLTSSMLSTKLTFPVPAISGDPNMEVKQFKGMTLIRSERDPKALNLGEIPSENFKVVDMLLKAMEQIAGLTSVQRGDVAPNIKSGNAMALLASQAIQFQSSVSESYVSLLENVGFAIVTSLQSFANTKRLAHLVGKNNRSYVQEFTGADLNDVSGVQVDAGNILSRSVAGRVEMANAMMAQGIITPEQYIQIIKTGSMDQTTESKSQELLNIKRENEFLREGKPVKAIISDNHRIHYQEHMAILNSPEIRENEMLTSAVLEHCQSHIDLLAGATPDQLEMSGQAPLQSVVAMQQMMGMAMQQPPAEDAGDGPNGTGAAPKVPKAPKVSESVELPQNPLTGSSFNNMDGGLQ